jgi:transitional endoplasmic reticulum ATPase
MVPLKFSDIFDEHLKSVINKSLNFNADERFISLTNFSTYLNRDTLLSDNTSYGVAPKKNIKIKKTGNGFSDVAGMDDLKKLLQTKFIDTLNRPDHAKKYGLTIPNGMLLYGPPGCGKTFIAKKFGEEASYNFILVKPSDLSSIYVSGGEQKIGQLFDEAEKNAPSIICFDEVDAVMPNRSSGDNSQAIGSRVNEYLAQIDKCSERGIFCIGTTNRPNLIDAAVLRTGRLEHKIYVGPPDIEAREKMFELYLKNRHIEFDIDYKKFANLTKGIVASDIEFIVNQASHKCAMLDIRISNKVIIDVISSFTPSVPKNEIDRYEEEFNDNNKKSTSNNNHVMGFKKDRK